MPFNGALCLALVGLALVAERFSSAAGGRQIRTALAAIVALVSGLVLLEHMLDPVITIDLPELHQPFADETPREKQAWSEATCVPGCRENRCRNGPRIRTRERTIAVSTSLGVAFHRGEGDFDAEELLKRADEALYRAKAAGRNKYRVGDGPDV